MGQLNALLKKRAGWIIFITVIVIICCVIYFWRDIKKYMGLDTRENFQVVPYTYTYTPKSWVTTIGLNSTSNYRTYGFNISDGPNVETYIIKTVPVNISLSNQFGTAIISSTTIDSFDTGISTYQNVNLGYVFYFGIAKKQEDNKLAYMPLTIENTGSPNDTIFDKKITTSYSITLKPAYIQGTPNYYYMGYIYWTVSNAFRDITVTEIYNNYVNINNSTSTSTQDPVKADIPIAIAEELKIYKDYKLSDKDSNNLKPLFFNENYIQPDVSGVAEISTAYKVIDTDSGTGGGNHSIHYNTKNGSIFPCWTFSNQYAKYYGYNFYKNWIFNYRFKDYMTVKFTRDLTTTNSTLPSVCIYISFFHNRTTYYLVNPPDTYDITFTTDILLATPFKQITYSTLNNASKYITKDGTKILGVDAISSSYQAQLKLFQCDSSKYEPVELTNTEELNSKIALHNVKRPWFLFDSQLKIYMRNDGFNDQYNNPINYVIQRKGGFTSLYGAGNYAPYLIIDTATNTIKLDSALHKIPLGETTTPDEQQIYANSASQFEIVAPAKLDVGTFSTTYTIKDLYKFAQGSTITVYGFIHPSSNPAYCKLISYPDYKPITLATVSSVLNTIDNTIYKYDGQNTLTYSILSPDNCPEVKKLGATGFVLSLNKFTMPDETLEANYTTDDKTWSLTNKAIPSTKLFKKYIKTDDPNIYIFVTTDNEYLAFDLVSPGLKLVPVTSININERFVNNADGNFIYYKNQVRFLIDAVEDSQYYLKNIPLEAIIRSVSLFFTEFTPTTTTSPPTESNIITTTTLPPNESNIIPTISPATPTISPATPTSTISPATPTLTISPATSTIPVTTTTKYITTTTTPSPIDMGTYIPAAPGVISFPVIQ